MENPMTEEIPALPLKTALTIATSDSGGGAGIQADLKTFAAFGVYGLCVLSGVSAQNTVAVTGLEMVSPLLVTAQLKAVFDDFEVDSIKIGLLGNKPNALAVASFLSGLSRRPQIVLDPVLVSASGYAFLGPEAEAALKELMPLASLATPNIHEAKALTGIDVESGSDAALLEAAQAIAAMGAQQVLIKGGHGQSPECRDLVYDSEGHYWLDAPRVQTPNNHGTGCTLSSAIAAGLARGDDMEAAIGMAKHYVTEGLKQSINLGHGSGPLNHFHQYSRYSQGGRARADA
jgi:hydroxymethylpyrimidine/phosphomethylpyrimidine kinase